MRFGKPSWPTAEMIAQARHNMATVQNIQSEGLTSRNVQLNTLGGSGDLKGSLTGFSGGKAEQLKTPLPSSDNASLTKK